MVSITVWVNSNGQAYVTIPKAIFEGLKWKHGTKLDVEILGKDKLKVERVKSWAKNKKQLIKAS